MPNTPKGQTHINVVVSIAAQQQGFLATVARLLSSHCDVTVVCSPAVKAVLAPLFPELAFDAEDYGREMRPEQIVPECLAREERYGQLFSMIISHDRALGKGYLFNADRHPDIARSWWSHVEKLRHVLNRIINWETVFQKYHPKLVVGLAIDPVVGMIARHHGVTVVGLATARFGNRYMWFENEHMQSPLLENAIRRSLDDLAHHEATSEFDYEQVSASKRAHRSINYSYRGAFVAVARRVLRESQGTAKSAAADLLRRRSRRERVGYRFLGWVPNLLRRPYIYRYIQKHGKTPSALAGYRLIYVPLHLEPEVALLSVSPEFNNSMEMIAWVSKSAPADTLLVVKEQPFSYGVRSRHYYDNLRRIGNVVLANPRVHPWEWIKASSAVATITGTAGIEAVHFGKPVLSFGKHQAINLLPTVRYTNSFESTRQHLRELLRMDSHSKVFKIAREALYRAQMESSFEFPGYLNAYRSREPQIELAAIAIAQLQKSYPEILPAVDGLNAHPSAGLIRRQLRKTLV